MESTVSQGMRNLKLLLGLPVEEDAADDEAEEVEADTMKQLQDLCAPHRHQPSSLDTLVTETGSVFFIEIENR